MYYDHGISISSKGQIKCPDRWTFQGAFFFAGTILTTIGDLACKTIYVNTNLLLSLVYFILLKTWF